jgi:hypothetical protein
MSGKFVIKVIKYSYIVACSETQYCMPLSVKAGTSKIESLWEEIIHRTIRELQKNYG